MEKVSLINTKPNKIISSLHSSDLKFLFDPRNQEGEGKNGVLSHSINEDLGQNILDDKLEDFTVYEDSSRNSCKAKWVLDKNYNRARSSYIGDGYSARFYDGGTCQVNVANESDFELGNFCIDFSINVKQKPATSSYWPIVTFENYTVSGFRIFINEDGRIYFYSSKSGDISIVGSSDITHGRKTHIVCQIYSNGTNYTAEIYVNGGLEATVDDTYTIPSAQSFIIGRPASLQSDFNLYDMRFHSIKRTSTEIQSMFNNSFTQDQYVLADWRFNNNTTYLTDHSSYGNDHALTFSTTTKIVSGDCDYIGQDWISGGAIVINDNEAINGGFDSDTSWTKGTGWTISSGVANANCGVSVNINQDASLTTGTLYKLTYTITSYTSGRIRAQVGGVYGLYKNKPGTYTEYFVAENGFITFWSGATYGFVGSIDNVYVKEVINGNHLTVDPDFYNNFPGTESNIYKNGKALQFFDSPQYFSIPAAQATDFNPGTGDFTVSCWVKGDVTSLAFIVGKYTSATAAGWALAINSNTEIRGYIINSSSNRKAWQWTVSSIQDTWTHLALVIVGSTRAMTLYVNSVDAGTGTAVTEDGSTPIDVDNSVDLLIGKESTDTYYFDGYISEVAYYDEAISSDGILDLYNSSKNIFMVTYGDRPNSFDNDNWSLKVESSSTYSNSYIKLVSNLNLKLDTIYKYTLNLKTVDTHTNITYLLGEDINIATLPVSIANQGWKKIIRYFKVSTETTNNLYIYAQGSDGEYWWYDNIKIQEVRNREAIGLLEGSLGSTGWGVDNAGIDLDGVNDCIDFGQPWDNVGQDKNTLICWWSKGVTNHNILSFYHYYFEVGISTTNFSGYHGIEEVPYWAGINNYVVPHGVTTTNWNHFAIYLDYINQEIRFYANGVKITTKASSGTLKTITSGSNLYLGCRSGTVNFADGLVGITSVHTFEDSLSADPDSLVSEIKSLQDGLYT